MRVNPFTYGNPISDTNRFFGREREVEQVFSRLRNVESESSSLVGERRIGKTSLLNYLAHPSVRQARGLNSEHFLFVYMDLQMVDSATTPARLWQRLLQQMGRHCPKVEIRHAIEGVSRSDSVDNFALGDLFDAVDEADLHFVFLLDEFENVTENPNFGPDFFYGLRSLAIHHNLSLITSSRRELIDLCHSEAIRSSPFFNIFANINLGPFSQQEARHLITTSLAGAGISFEEAEIKLILRLTGAHPYFLQSACHFLFQAYGDYLDPDRRVKFLVEKFRQEATPHLGNYWQNSDDHEKIVMTALALLERQGKVGGHAFSIELLRNLYAHSDQTMARLEKRSLVIPAGDAYALVSSLLGEWIAGEITGTLANQQNYEDWLKSHRSSIERLSEKARGELAVILPQISDRYRGLFIAWVSDPRNLAMVAGLLRSALGSR